MRKELIAHKNPKSPNSEIFRTLRTNIQFMNTKKKLKTLLITSTFPGEGKSWVTSNLAVTFAQAGKKVVVVDADMRKGRQYRIFEITPKPGLSNYLSEAEIDENDNSSVSIANYVQETEVDNLFVIPAGSVPPNPSELLVSPQMLKGLEDLKEMFDLVIIDGTPCELVTDAIILSRICDCTVIVAAHKITKKDALARVVKNIQNVGGNLAGVVINKMPVSAKRYGQSYYYYGESSKSNHKRNSKSGLFAKSSHKQNNNELEKNIANLYENANIERNEEVEPENNQNVVNNQVNEEVSTPVNFVDNNSTTENVPVMDNNNEQNNNGQDGAQSFIEKTNEIMQQINDYLDNEKNNLK